MKTAYDKMVAELARCGWKTLPITNKVWLSVGSFRERRDASNEIAKLTASAVPCKTNHSNYKGTTVWAERDGIVLRMIRPATYRWTGDFRMVAEFTPDGSYIRGYSHTDTPYNPSGYGFRRLQSTGETLKVLMHHIQVSSPENLERLKEGDIQRAKDKLQGALTKKAEYEAKRQGTKDAVVALMNGSKDFDTVFEDIIQKGLLALPYCEMYRQADIEEAKKDLDMLQRL